MEVDLIDDAGKVGADHHAVDGLHGADRAQRAVPLFLRRLIRRPLRDRRANLVVFEKADRRDESEHDDEHDDHSFGHNLKPSGT